MAKIVLFAALLSVGACTYNLDTPAMNDLRERQRALEQTQSALSSEMSAIEQKQAENDAKIRLMWSRGK